MEQKIIDLLKKAETQNDIKVVFACEAGSRAYGLSSNKSDYDARFIFIYRKEDYLTIDEKRDVIEGPLSGEIDLHGWELKKALKLLRKSNPSLLEWLYSPIVYHKDPIFLRKMKKLAFMEYSPETSMHHYFRMVKGNYKDYLKANDISAKKLFRCFRPLLICRWIETNEGIPPVEFHQLAKEVLPDKLYNSIHSLVEELRRGETKGSPHDMVIIQQFMDQEIARMEVDLLRLTSVHSQNITPKLDHFFQETLHRVWDINENEE